MFDLYVSILKFLGENGSAVGRVEKALIYSTVLNEERPLCRRKSFSCNNCSVLLLLGVDGKGICTCVDPKAGENSTIPAQLCQESKPALQRKLINF